MKKYKMLHLGLLMLMFPATALEAKVDLLYSEKVEGRFRADVEYKKKSDGREFCEVTMMDYNGDASLSLIVPGERSSTAFIMLSLPKSLLGLKGNAKLDGLNFEFVEGGKPTKNSVMGTWNFRVRDTASSKRFVSHLLTLRVDDLWGFARDWHDTSAVFVTDEVGKDVVSLTLYRSEEVMQNFADCWSLTAGD